jgi:hypothetical protein
MIDRGALVHANTVLLLTLLVPLGLLRITADRCIRPTPSVCLLASLHCLAKHAPFVDQVHTVTVDATEAALTSDHVAPLTAQLPVEVCV